MSEKKRVRTRASTAVVSAFHAVGQGRPRQCSTDEYQDELLPSAPAVPELIADDPIAASIFQNTVTVLIKRKVLKATHLTFVTAYAKAVGIYFAKPDELCARGYVSIKEDGTYTPSVANVQHQAFQQLSKFGSLLGMDPISELRLGLINNAKDKESENSFAEFA